MYYLGSFGTHSSSKVITVQERMRLLREKLKNKENEIDKSDKLEKILEKPYKMDIKEERKNKTIYISSKYNLNLFIF
jgi:hypothetical protein